MGKSTISQWPCSKTVRKLPEGSLLTPRIRYFHGDFFLQPFCMGFYMGIFHGDFPWVFLITMATPIFSLVKNRPRRRLRGPGAASTAPLPTTQRHVRRPTDPRRVEPPKEQKGGENRLIQRKNTLLYVGLTYIFGMCQLCSTEFYLCSAFGSTLIQ